MAESRKKRPLASKPLSECTLYDVFTTYQAICVCCLCVPCLGFIFSPILVLPVEIKDWWICVLVYGLGIVWCLIYMCITFACCMCCCVSPLRHVTTREIYTLAKFIFKMYLLGYSKDKLDRDGNLIPDEIKTEEENEDQLLVETGEDGMPLEEVKGEISPDEKSNDNEMKIDGFDVDNSD